MSGRLPDEPRQPCEHPCPLGKPAERWGQVPSTAYLTQDLKNCSRQGAGKSQTVAPRGVLPGVDRLFAGSEPVPVMQDTLHGERRAPCQTPWRGGGERRCTEKGAPAT